jgi:UDP-N-acetylmuramoyl-tripeptide--D-alanyl-D-alanine ligase
MRSNNISAISRVWLGPVTKEHIRLIKNTPKEYLYKLLIHPIKRRVAKYYLVLLRKVFGLKVVGITGSAGKSTTKEMAASILVEAGKTVASYANIDPVYNIPSTILKCTPQTRFLVLEMGVEFPGEMDFYLWLAKPDIGLITNIYPVHTEYLRNIQGIAKEKGKLVRGLPSGGFAVLNKENSNLREISKEVKAKILWYGKGGDIQGENISYQGESGTKFTLVDDKNKLVVQLPIIGEQFVNNALGASAIAYCLGLRPKDIKNGLEKFKPLEHRMATRALKGGALLLDDSYNNNPEAAKQALKTLKSVAGGRKMIVVFGAMLELGTLSSAAHKELGEVISSMGVEKVIGVGEASKDLIKTANAKMGDNAIWIPKADKVLPALKPLLIQNTVVLIKGSRGVGLDRLVAKLV